MELIVVVGIIAILTSVVLSNISTAKQRSRDAKRVSDVTQIKLSLELYFNRCNQYPATLTAAASNGCPSGITLDTFLSPMPLPPLGSAETSYNDKYSALNTNCTAYHLGATLENATDNSFRDDADASAGSKCSGSNDDFNGTDPIYDVKS